VFFGCHTKPARARKRFLRLDCLVQRRRVERKTVPKPDAAIQKLNSTWRCRAAATGSDFRYGMLFPPRRKGLAMLLVV
jgi:hypothetical protein